MNLVSIIAVLGIFVVCPCSLLTFLYKLHKDKHELKKLEHQKKLLELEIEKQNNQILLLNEENKKLDKIIYES